MANRFIGGVLSSKQPQSSGFVSRASTGTYFDSTGVLRTAPANQPRLNRNFTGQLSANRYSALFTSASTNYLSAVTAASALGTGNFTMEFWWKANSTTQSNYSNIINQGFTGSPSNGAFSFKVYSTSNILNFTYYNNSISDNSTSANVNDLAWHHIAASRNGTSLGIYVDGVLNTTITLPASFNMGASGGTTYIGYNPRDASYINGHVKDLRLITGQALYSGTFTPPTVPLTTTSVGSTGAGAAATLTGTVILLTCQTASLNDVSSNNYAITNTNTVTASLLLPPNLGIDTSGTGWSQPSVLIEPASTNIITYSEQINNAAWSKIGDGSRTGITANAATAPDGNTTADLVYVYNGQTSISGGAYWPYTFTNGVTYTWSCFFKYVGYQYVYMGTDNNNSSCVWFDLSAGTVGSTSTGFRGTITNVGNGWYRCATTFTFASASMGNAGPIMGCANIDGTVTLTQAGNGSNGVYMWGAQLEVNSLGATSYIPTVASAVTRAQDTTGVVGSGVYTLAQLENQTSIDDQFTIQSFPNVGSNYNWTAPEDVVSVEVLVVAGGGGANNSSGGNSTGGGGGGGVIYNTSYPVVPGVTYPIIVGAGGAPAASNSVNPLNGGNSQFGALVAIGGGWGKGRDTTGSSGGNGGSGGGGDTYGNVGGRGVSGQGYSGGNGVNFSSGVSGGGGGGGGAAGPGGNAIVQAGGVNGPGLGLTISGTLVYYGAGGVGQSTGGSNTTPVAGGTASNTNGTANTGAGGAGGSTNNGTSTGGSGVVVVKYRRTNRQLAATSNAAVVVQKFTVSNTWIAPAGVTQVEALVIGGGGGAGGGEAYTGAGGGGGAGGVVYNSAFSVTPGSTYTITIGNGGTGGTANSGVGDGTNGASSLVGTGNLVSNGNFTNGTTGWTDPATGAEGTFVAANGAVSITNTNSSDPPACIYQAITCVVGHTYVVTTSKISGINDSFVTNITTGVSTTGGTGGFGNVIYFPNSGAQGTLTGTFTAAQTSYYIFLRLNTNAVCTAVVTNIGVYNITAGTSLVAIGGGAGGRYSVSGYSGGSGGGGGNSSASGGSASQPASGSGGFGNAGAVGATYSSGDFTRRGGGGGGASSPGIASSAGVGGAGGAGIPFSITGNLEYYAGGGGGGYAPNAGGIGGGGTFIANGSNGSNGAPNSGGGGGGSGSNNNASIGGNGGSGVVILRYRVPQVVTFQDSGAWTCPAGVTSVQALIVAGGGGGGAGSTASQLGGGGGGAGGLIYNTSIPVTPGVTYPVVVGQGGIGGVTLTSVGSNGQNSSFSNLIAIGGGYGALRQFSENGSAGGSGGGGAGGAGAVGGSGTYGQGNSGATTAGGGGGAGSAGVFGQSSTEPTGGAGGGGLQFSIGGTATYYAGGGASGAWGGATINPGSLGGGGGGGPSRNNGFVGAQNTGGGGGGSGSGYRNSSLDTAATGNGAVGGSGIVIIRWYGG